MADTIKVTILEDGTFKIETDAVSAANHGNAEMLLREIAKDAGGDISRVKKAGVHSHGHLHEHDGHWHTH